MNPDQRHAFYSSLETSIKEKDAFIAEAQRAWAILKDDFTYNLTLLEERDRELEQFDLLVDNLKTEISERDAQVSDLKILLSERVSELASLRSLCQIQEQQHAEAIRKTRKEKETALEEMESRLRAAEQENEQVRLETKLQAEALNQEVSAHRDLEKRLRESEWELNDYKKLMSTTVAEMQHKLTSSQEEMTNVSAMFDQQRQRLLSEMEAIERSHQAELQRSAERVKATRAEMDAVVRESYEENERHKNELVALDALVRERDQAISGLAAAVECREKELARLTESHIHEVQRMTNEFSQRTESYRDEILQLTKNYEAKAHQQMMESTTNAEIVRDLKSDLQTKNDSIQSLREELAKRIEAERHLQIEAAEQALAWQQKLIEAERKREKLDEHLVRTLMKDKDELEAEVRLLKSELQSFGSLDTLKADYQSIQGEAHHLRQKLADSESANEQLRQAVHQMRQDMELVQNAFHKSQSQSTFQQSQTQNPYATPPPQRHPQHHDASHEELSKEVSNLKEEISRKEQIISSLLISMEELQRKHGSGRPRSPTIPTTQQQQPHAHADASAVDQLLADNVHLREKLRSAVDDIARMGRERARVIEASNAAHAEMKRVREEARRDTKTVGVQTNKDWVRVTQNVPAITLINPAPSAPTAGATDKGAAPTSPKRWKAKRGPVDSAADQKMAMRAKGVRNWNDRTD
ncbi:hypothetical protein HK101_011290 [Irineochytrium annulatum]|nr:hypothetical protein HK101_011290 [Irineochytrium annulatum]